jgi:oxygen-independent coproporphyrinogen-3 oxidase
VPLADYAARTGLALDTLRGPLDTAVTRGWLHADAVRLRATPSGQRFLNDVVALFMR